jgi:hypothetical protein
VTAYFLDSTALVTRCLREPGAAWVRTISTPSAGNTVLVSFACAPIDCRFGTGELHAPVAQDL